MSSENRVAEIKAKWARLKEPPPDLSSGPMQLLLRCGPR